MSLPFICLCVLVFCALIAAIRIILGPTVWDRLLALNMISAKILIAIVLIAALTGRSFLLDIALVYALLGYISTVLFARIVRDWRDRT